MGLHPETAPRSLTAKNQPVHTRLVFDNSPAALTVLTMERPHFLV
ncbi:hypothetical protein EDC14_10289 [Hydrogenispora ethanolica]|uniref:Uncharacterized protein n=1 Tax=Hydrogenispora ethanolica TaxID=1082276 RepID=A0A4R1R8R0_HYDET|nr:hypothetical protein EDC14_10289 [Hydrogenispora ethanolica]